MKRYVWLAMLSLAWVSKVGAVPTMDGKASVGEGYTALTPVQNTNTQFGDSTTGDAIQNNGGNEIDQVFGVVSGGRLYVTVAGNLKMGFDKLDIFVDSIAGGLNTVGTGLPVVDEYCCGSPTDGDGALQRMSSLVFDSGFEADYFMTITHGGEHLTSTVTGGRDFWAISAHYADLTSADLDGLEGLAAGMQLAYRGQPNVLRFPGDYNDGGKVDGADYVTWRKTQGQAVPRGSGADANGNQIVDGADYNVWRSRFNDGTTLTDYAWVPNDVGFAVSEALLGPQLPGLSQGQLIDRAYALGAGGCADDTGAGCLAAELEFALANQRNFNNSIGLQLALDNSNTVGVTTAEPFTTPTAGNPGDVSTGIEFSLPLSAIGNPTGPIKLTIFVNNGEHSYISNQFAGDGILLGNVGPSPFPNLDLDYPGNQFVTVANPGVGSGGSTGAVPEPGSLALAVVAGLAACGLVRRK